MRFRHYALAETHQDSRRLRTRCRASRHKHTAVSALYEFFSDCPFDSLQCKGTDISAVRESGQISGFSRAVTLILNVAVKYGCHLLASYSVVWGEQSCIISFNNLRKTCPSYRSGIVFAFRNICKCFSFCLRCSLQAMQDSYYHAARDGQVR